MIPCEKTEDIKEIKDDVKEIKTMLINHLVKVEGIRKDVGIHRKLWGGLIGIIISIAVALFKNPFE